MFHDDDLYVQHFEELVEAREALERLLVSIAPTIKPLDSLAGVYSQISNLMAASRLLDFAASDTFTGAPMNVPVETITDGGATVDPWDAHWQPSQPLYPTLDTDDAWGIEEDDNLELAFHLARLAEESAMVDEDQTLMAAARIVARRRS